MTAYSFISRWAALVSMTPGRSLLRNTTGWSNAPAATMHCLARTLYRRLPWITGRKLSVNQALQVASLRIWMFG
ncbi:hypothetical protein D3C77_737820 [compost metagenome]